MTKIRDNPFFQIDLYLVALKKNVGEKMLEYAMICDIGGRNVNEDCAKIAHKDKQHCFVVCDGLGGHGMGDVASSLVADVFVEQFNSSSFSDELLATAFDLAQQILLEHQVSCNAETKMKTTASVLITDDKKAYIGHVGDSRVYVFSDDKVKLRTIDHSVSQMLALSGEITDAEIRGHSERNILLRAMGTKWERPMYDISQPIKLSECQAFLLCSDGFWENITEEEMSQALKSSCDVTQWLSEMVSVVLKNGKEKNMDNYTAIAVWNI